MILRNKLTSTSGIYQIESNINGKIYIGSTCNFIKRKREHFYQLKRKKHHSEYLQNHFNKYGQDDLEFSIIEFCPKEKLIEREQYWIDTLHPEFNICLLAFSSLGFKFSEKSKQKIKQNFYINHTSQSFKKQGLSLKKKWQDEDFRKHQQISRQKAIDDPEKKRLRKKNRSLFWESEKGKLTRKKIGQAHKNIPKSKHHLEKCSISIRNFYKSEKGINLRNERSKEMVLSHRLQTPDIILKRCKSVRQYSLSNNFIKEYPSIIQASKEIGIHKNLISACICNTQKTAGGYIWKRA